MIDDVKEFDSKITYLKNNQGMLSNNGEKLNQLMEKIVNERNYWGRCAHLGHFTSQINFVERIESIKVKLNDFFGEKR